MRRKLFIIGLFIVLLFALGACKQTNVETKENEEQGIEQRTDEDRSFPITIKHDGKEITIEEKPENILPLSLEVAEIVLELVDPSIVPASTNGIDDPYLSTKSDLADKIPGRISAASNIDPEQILSYETDLLLLTKMYGEQEEAEKVLSELNTPIISFDAFVTVEQMINGIEVIGKAIGEQEKASELIQTIKDELEQIEEQLPKENLPSLLVLSEVGGDLGPFMMGPTNISYDLIQYVGATPAVDDIGLERSTPASMEQIMKMDPDYILLVDFFGNGEKGFASLMDDPGWQTLDAVKEDRLHMIEAKYFLNPNVQNIKGVQQIATWIHGFE